MSNDLKSTLQSMSSVFEATREKMQDYSVTAVPRLHENLRLQRLSQEIYEHKHQLENPVIKIAETLKKQIKLFESKLNQDEDVMIMAASFGSTVIFYVHAIEFSKPNIIIFYGSDESGNEISLIQHCNQLNFLLQVGKRENPEEKRNPIGFIHPKE